MAREKKTEKTEKAAAPKTAKGKAAKPAAKAPSTKAGAKSGGKATAKAAPKVKAERPEPRPMAPRHPAGRVKAAFGSKEDLVKKLAEPLAVGDEDPDTLGERLKRASNQQLLRLAKVVETVQQKYGSRDKLIQSLGSSLGKAKDKDYLAKLGTFSLPRLLDMAKSVGRRPPASR